MILAKMNQLQQRLAIGAISSILTLLFIILSPYSFFKPIFSISIAAIIGISMWELYQIMIVKGLQPAMKIGISYGVLYALAIALETQYRQAVMLPAMILLLALISLFLYYFMKSESPLLNLSSTLFAIVYLAVPLSCMIQITYFFTFQGIQDGRWWLFYLVAVTKMTDTGGFFIGKWFGKEKLAPYISPKKTWEGALGGLLAAIFMSVLIKYMAAIFDGNAFSLTFWQSLWLGAGIGIFAQFGDLSESLLKRDGGIKDSNRLPGLGGILDIVDSLVFTSPLVYIFIKVQV